MLLAAHCLPWSGSLYILLAGSVPPVDALQAAACCEQFSLTDESFSQLAFMLNTFSTSETLEFLVEFHRMAFIYFFLFKKSLWLNFQAVLQFPPKP